MSYWIKYAVLSILKCSKVSKENFVEQTDLHCSQLCFQCLRRKRKVVFVVGFSFFLIHHHFFCFCWCLQPHFISLNSRCSSCLSFHLWELHDHICSSFHRENVTVRHWDFTGWRSKTKVVLDLFYIWSLVLCCRNCQINICIFFKKSLITCCHQSVSEKH